MKAKAKAAMEALTKKAEDSQDSNDALKFSQSVLNLAKALEVLKETYPADA